MLTASLPSPQLRAAGFDPLAATIRASPRGRRQGQETNIPKSALLLRLVAAVEAGRLNVVAFCPLRDALAAEPASFRRAAGARGQMLITQGGVGHHGDLGIAVALARLGQSGLGCPRSSSRDGRVAMPAKPSVNRPLSLAAYNQLRTTIGEPLLSVAEHAGRASKPPLDSAKRQALVAKLLEGLGSAGRSAADASLV